MNVAELPSALTLGALIRAARLAATLTREEQLRREAPRGQMGSRPLPTLTQTELAERMKTSQAVISGAERGKCGADPAFVARVLAACRLPAGWTP